MKSLKARWSLLPTPLLWNTLEYLRRMAIWWVYFWRTKRIEVLYRKLDVPKGIWDWEGGEI
jgi:hypothetical protein